MKKKLYNNVLRLTLFTLIAFLPLQWITVFSIIGLKFKFLHFSFLLFPLLLLFYDYRLALYRFLKKYVLIFATYSLLLMAYLISISWTKTFGGASSYIIKSTFYCIYSILLGAVLLEIFRLKSQKILVTSAITGSVLFLIYFNLAFYMQGQSPLKVLAFGLLSGNPKVLMYQIYSKVFNFDIISGKTLTYGADEFIRSSLRNTIAGCFLFNFFILKLFSKPSFWIKVVIFLNVFFLLITVSRSNITTFLLSLIVIFILNINKNIGKKIAVISSMGLASLIFLFTFWETISNIFNGLFSRFSDVSDDSRFEMYELVSHKLQHSPILGYGLGAKVMHRGLELNVHNIFLNAWYMSGLLGLICSILFYVLLLYIFIDKLWKYIFYKYKYNPTYNSIPIYWGLVLPILPLLRTLIGSGNSDFTLVEWSLLSLYFSLFYILQPKKLISLNQV